jgi:hypothetical protein
MLKRTNRNVSREAQDVRRMGRKMRTYEVKNGDKMEKQEAGKEERNAEGGVQKPKVLKGSG